VLEIVQRDVAGCGSTTSIPVTTALALVPAILGAAFAAASCRRNRRCVRRSWRPSNMNDPDHSPIGVVALVLHGVVASARAGLRRRRATRPADARQIVAEAQRRGSSESQRYEGLLQTFDARGRDDREALDVRAPRVARAEPVVIRFTAPPEVRGVALLIVNHPDRASDQWMWTPAHRARPPHRAAGSLDALLRHRLQLRGPRGARRRSGRLRAARRGADRRRACWKIQSTPKARVVAVHPVDRLDPQGQLRVGAHRLVREGRAVRRLQNLDIQNIQGIWTRARPRMSDMRRGSVTRLVLDKVEYNVPLREDDFTLQALRRQ
jgi:hypothetical protein